MSVLSNIEIEKYCKNFNMIDPFDKEKVQGSSYDLSVGDEYRFSHGKKVIKMDGWRREIKIPPYAICYILVKEKLHMPKDICAEIFPRHTLVKKGLLMYPQPPIDPGFEGKLYVLIHNLTNKDRSVYKDEHLVSLVFYKLGQKTDKPYNGKYQGQVTLEGLGLNLQDMSRYSSALKNIAEEIKSWRERLFSTYIPILLILMTIFLMVLTILFSNKLTR